MATKLGPQTLTAAIYVRISSDQDLERLGVERQAADCRERVKRNGWKLHRVYEDNDISAYSGKVRPSYRQLLEDVQAGAIQVIVTWAPDRLYRSLRDLSEFIEVIDKAGCQVECVKAGNIDFTTANGRMIGTILGATAIGESALKSERLRRKHQQLADDGKDAGGGRPFGYEEDRKTVRESEAALVREAARRLLEGETLRSICRDWTARQVPTVRGGKWSAQVMRRMLASARISGRREHRTNHGERRDIGEITCDTAEWKGIISAADSDRIRELLADPARRRNAGRHGDYLLTRGLSYCGLCGKPLVARPRGDKRRCMVCASGPGFNGCGKIRTLAEPLEELVTEAVLQAVEGGALAAALVKTDDSATREELVGVEAKLAGLARDWAADLIGRKEWLAARDGLAARQTALQRRLEVQRREHQLDGVPDPLRSAWPSLPLHRRRGIIAVLIDRVIVGPAVAGRNFFDPERVELRWKV